MPAKKQEAVTIRRRGKELIVSPQLVLWRKRRAKAEAKAKEEEEKKRLTDYRPLFE